MSMRVLWSILISVLFVRFMILGMYPLMDTSEARYGEMARKMVELNDWVTPMFDYGVPFWGKPPLSFWTQALSIKVFGANEFAVRFPSFLFHILSCIILIRWGREELGLRYGLLSAIIYSSCGIGFIVSGSVLTDPALAFSLLLAVYGFWRSMVHGDRILGLFGFLGLGLGMLAKGPLILVIFGVPALLWVAYLGYWARLGAIPWLRGVGVFLIVSVPWYVIAELKTPGFLEYFFIGEHWNRYVVSGWNGDLYGNAHARTVGTIWVYLLAATMPWIVWVPFLFSALKSKFKGSALLGFCVVYIGFLPLFFTFSKNILWTYVLPVIPLFSLALSACLLPYFEQRKRYIAMGLTSFFVPVLLLGFVLEGSAFETWKSQKNVIREMDSFPKGDLYYLNRRVYSSEFYSRGSTKTISTEQLIGVQTPFYLAVLSRDLDKVASSLVGCISMFELDKTNVYRCSGTNID
ncbi:glycosyltransferase family 39 protein [uncultured Pseudoteredinibacter sp.]|uniref:ArnT family glycosyltransferase n=1 Tax=uncultured Pseudoteredinibacter sp. TaxID=1641701 RepID=UPI0026293615|nr:glycosyltransferase family 39 protein [uncultured Pseudoteredinibacter sp.]